MVSVKKAVRETKGKKCDYCDDFAVYKVPDAGLYLYLCDNCYANQDAAKNKLNEFSE